MNNLDIDTNLARFLDSLDLRWKEVEKLLELAEEYEENDFETCNYLKRSAFMLTVSHYEGSFKNSIEMIVKDLCNNIEFNNLNFDMKKAYIEYYSDEKNKNSFNRIQEKFEDLSISDFNYRAFLTDSQSKSKNLSPQEVNSIIKKFGIKNLGDILKNSDIDKIFENNQELNEIIFLELKNNLECNCSNFPYNLTNKVTWQFEGSDYIFERANYTNKKVDINLSMYGSFLNGILSERHRIVHGSDLNISKTINQIKSDILKIKTFILLIIYLIALELQDICS